MEHINNAPCRGKRFDDVRPGEAFVHDLVDAANLDAVCIKDEDGGFVRLRNGECDSPEAGDDLVFPVDVVYGFRSARFTY